MNMYNGCDNDIFRTNDDVDQFLKMIEEEKERKATMDAAAMDAEFKEGEHPRSENGRFGTGSGGGSRRGAMVFGSPNRDPLTLSQALAKTGGKETQHYIAEAEKHDEKFHHTTTESPATRFYEGGAEPSVITRFVGNITNESLHKSAALKGKISEATGKGAQDTMLTWYSSSRGPQHRVEIKVSGKSSAEVAAISEKLGIAYGTVEPAGKDTILHILYLDGAPKRGAVTKITDAMGSSVATRSRGNGSFIHADDYDSIIAS